MAVRLAIFAREPQMGCVKTRLAAVVGNQQALAVYEQLLTHTLVQAALSGLPSELWVTGSNDCPRLTLEAERRNFGLCHQPVGDLGLRMSTAMAAIGESGDSALIIGTDCPQLRSHHLLQAAHEMTHGSDVVLGPALDGGYYLLGSRWPEPRLFADVPWGTGSVLRRTLEAARECQLPVCQLATLRDVDTAEDFSWAVREGYLA